MPKIPSRLGGFIVKHCGDYFRTVRKLDAPGPRPRTRPNSVDAPGATPSRHRPDAPSGRTPQQQQWDDGLTRRPDGRTTHRNDPPGTYRDRNGRLHDDKGPFTKDPNPRPSSDKPIDHRAQRGSPEKHTVSDDTWNSNVSKREDLQGANTSARQEYDEISRELGVSDISPSDARKMTPEEARSRGLTDDQYQDLRGAAETEGAASQRLRNHSEDMGHQATQDVMRRRGEEPIPSSGRGSGRFDEMSISRDAQGNPTSLNIYEAKGGDSPLGARDTPHGRAQQGSPEYLSDVMQRDPDLRDFLQRNPDIAEGLASGKINVHYSEVRAHPSRDVTITPFQ
ncbi:hypothetical protein [Propioniferax innocua]|uniref:Uncharacterized protein n=1 Tax=Propioniferax innocua TaxID=1753 RepID=A0A542ZQV1_9ACTN|nr:hypothetical protein [Propioniferax innocua]TQL62735.1 hypothetical protein FB460_0524 [Propioniferax innocua]